MTSPEQIIGALRGRKTPAEAVRIRAAVETTRQIYERAFDFMQPGMTERDVAEFMHDQMGVFGVTPAWTMQVARR